MQRIAFRPRLLTLIAVLLAALAASAVAQDAPTVTLAEHETYGSYLADAEGNALYLFVNEEAESTDPERMTEGVRSNAAPCAGGCLEAWPPLTGASVEAGEGVDPELLYVEDVGGTMMAVYNGWPLYYFANDAAPGDVNGQGLGEGNVWYLVDAQGAIIPD